MYKGLNRSKSNICLDIGECEVWCGWAHYFGTISSITFLPTAFNPSHTPMSQPSPQPLIPHTLPCHNPPHTATVTTIPTHPHIPHIYPPPHSSHTPHFLTIFHIPSRAVFSNIGRSLYHRLDWPTHTARRCKKKKQVNRSTGQVPVLQRKVIHIVTMQEGGLCGERCDVACMRLLVWRTCYHYSRVLVVVLRDQNWSRLLAGMLLMMLL